MTISAKDVARLSVAGWAARPDRISKTYTFRDFRAAIAFMVEASFECDTADHHPEWSNVYNRVTVELTTHDAGGVTGKDVALADAFDALFDLRA